MRAATCPQPAANANRRIVVVFAGPSCYFLCVRGGKSLLIFSILVAAIMIFARLGELPLRDPDEGRNAQVAREMQLNGAWLTPTYNNLVYLDKPSFYFKCVAISFALFGESETSARLPSALFGGGVLALAYAFCRREYDQKTGAFSVLVLATAPLFIALARHVIFDMTLTFFVIASIFAGYIAEISERRRSWYMLAAACSALATLVKGPVGFIVPTIVLAVFNIADKRTGWWKRHFHPVNVLVFFALTLPWFIGLSMLHPDFPRYGLLEESLKRFATKSFSRSAPFYYFGFVIIGGLFAWSVLVPEAVLVAWRNRARWSRADRLLIVCSITVVIFFSLSKSKLPHYILPAAVTLAMLLARFFVIAFERADGRAAAIIFRGLVALAILSAIVDVFLFINIFFPQAHETVFRIRSQEFNLLSLIFPTFACILGLIIVAALLARFTRNLRLAFATFLILPGCIVTVAFHAVALYSEASSSRQIAAFVTNHFPGADVASLESLPAGLPFYLKHPITLITATGSEISPYIVYSLRDRDHWPPGVIKSSDKQEWLLGKTNAVCILADKRSKWRLQELANAHKTEISCVTPSWWSLVVTPEK